MIGQELYWPPEGLDPILLTCQATALTGLEFLRERPLDTARFAGPGTYDALRSTRSWLDAYFKGEELPEMPLICLDGLSVFTREVLEMLLSIPSGQVTTYGALAKQMAEKKKIPKMSAQAIGGAVGRNPICILIPCHRVLGTNGSLTGFGGGMNNKVTLLRHEGIDLSKYTIPTKGTKL